MERKVTIEDKSVNLGSITLEYFCQKIKLATLILQFFTYYLMSN